MDTQGSFSLGSSSEGTHLFSRTVDGDYFQISAVQSGSTCYLAFTGEGVQVSNPCSLSGHGLEQTKLIEQ